MKAKTVFQKTSEGLGAQRVALLTLFVLVIGGHFLRPHTAQAMISWSGVMRRAAMNGP